VLAAKVQDGQMASDGWRSVPSLGARGRLPDGRPSEANCSGSHPRKGAIGRIGRLS
jgi:hypothetical protein